jgi:hypothetical protein
MRRFILALSYVAACIWVPAPAAAQTVTGGSADAVAAVARAVECLANRPGQIVIVDRTEAMAKRPTLSRRAEAFVPYGETRIYLIEQGEALRQAVSRRGVFDYALALTIWHEMAHAEGADEREAQRLETALWQRFILDGRVDRGRGMAFLAVLNARRQ